MIRSDRRAAGRLVSGLLLLSAVSSAYADRLISIPVGRKVPLGTIRSELFFEPHRGGTSEYYFAAGLSREIELEYRTQRLRFQDVREAIDLSYNFLAPVSDLSPGISVGVQDLFNRTNDRRRVYAALTYRQSSPTGDGDQPADLTIGAYAGENSSAFVGWSQPLSASFRLLADHNGYRLSAGFEYRPIRDLAVRFFARGPQTFMSLSYSKRF
ncbi:MAG: hypothetical protein SFX74_08085 [Fimbriimonadaceae bacterium]|nr:hypothetical protein [Fimbriimonadaceae bacterium]